MKLNEVYNQWVVWKEMQVKRSTILHYKNQYSQVIAPVFGDKELAELTKKNILPEMYGWLERGYSIKYCSDLLIILRMIMRYASDELEVDEVPNTTWKMIWPSYARKPNTGVMRYTKKEMQTIIDYLTDNPSPKNLGILLVCCTGMRIGEICGLRWEDVNIECRLIHISRTLERVWDAEKKCSEIIMSSTKTQSSTRDIPIISDIFQMVRNFSKTVRPDYYVCSGTEKPIEPRTFRNYYREVILNKVGFDHVVKFHGLRHTFASSLIENGVDVKTTASILGHSNVATTLNVYAHPSEDSKRLAINRVLGRLIKTKKQD